MDFRTIGRTSDVVSSSAAAAAAAASASAALLHLYHQPSSAMGTPQSPHLAHHLLHHHSSSSSGGGGGVMTSPTPPPPPPPLHHHPSMLHATGLWGGGGGGYPMGYHPTAHASGLASLSSASSAKLTAATPPPPPSAAAMINGNGGHSLGHLGHHQSMIAHHSATTSSNNNNGKCLSSSSSSSSGGGGGRTPAPSHHHGPLMLSDGTGDPMPSPVRSASVAAYLGQVQANNDVNSHRVTPSPSNNSNNNNNNRTTNTRSPQRQHQQRSSSSSSSSSSSKKESSSSSHKSSNRWARPTAAADKDSALTVSSASSASHATTAVTTRSRSPPVVTIAPTLSLSNLSHYQDSRKAYERAMLCHTVPSNGGVFNSSGGGIPGGLSTGLAGLSSLTNGHPYSSTSSLIASSNSNGPLTTNSSTSDYISSSAFSSIPPYGVYSAAQAQQQQPPPPQAPTPRPDDLFYGGLRSSMQQTAAAAAAAAAASANSLFRPEDSSNALGGMLPPRNLPMSLASSYHESLLSQLSSPSRSSSSSLLAQQQEEYLLATARSSGAYNPYGLSSLETHSNIHPSLYSNPFAFRSLEEQLYLERYGLLRPGSTASAMSSPYQSAQGQVPPSLSFPSYLNFRYPSPLLHPTPSDLAGLSAISNGAIDSAALNRMKLEEEQRIKERIREEELTAIANKFQNDRPASSIGRPLATVTPSRENVNSQQQRRDRDRQREKDKKKSERDRSITVQLPNESTTAVRGVKVNTVNPLYASYGLPTADPPVSRHYTGDLLLLPPTLLPPPTASNVSSINESLNSSTLSENGDLAKPSGELCNVSAEFSLGALEAMAVLKQQRDHSPARIVSTVRPQSDTKAQKNNTKSEEEPMDLSESSVTHIGVPRELTDVNRLRESASCNGSVTHELSNSEQPSLVVGLPSVVTADPNEGVRSLLDVRVERWKRKRGSEPGDDEDVDDDVLDQEVCASSGFLNGTSESNALALSSDSSTSPGSNHCSKGCTIPAGVSEQQHNFLHMFGLVTPQKRSNVELVKCIRRQKILREPTPPPIESEEEDSATLLLKQRTRLAATQVHERSNPSDCESKVPEAADPALCDFAVRLNLFPTDKQIVESVEKSWNIVVADRMRRHFGQQRETAVRKRLCSDTFRPLNFDQTPPNIDDQLKQATSEEPGDAKKEALCDPIIHKPVPQPNSGLFIPLQLPVTLQAVTNNHQTQPPSAEVLPMSVAKPLAKLELSSTTPSVNEENKSPLTSNIGCSNGKLTSEVAFWLRHLKPTMARTLTSNKETTALNGTNESINRSMSDDQSSSSPDSPSTEGPSAASSSTNEQGTLSRWPGTDSIMVLYMAHQQELSLETKFLREHCERLHVQLAEGQATLSKLCLALSSSVETQRRCKEEDAFTLQTINDLQMTLKLLQSSR